MGAELALKFLSAVLSARQQTHGSGLEGQTRPWCCRLGTYFELFFISVSRHDVSQGRVMGDPSNT
jgi:hypothetical protein